ncbi:MAG TPA: ATP-binding protein [Candidatus Binataceae bacterium]|nr:ATP-binding protein [Candidatus Binataceae bacterium]
MTRQIPLGQPENQTREFKSAEVLKHLASVGREVVAMLNTTDGGMIWIGLADSGGIAVQIEPIENADREIGRIRDHCNDSIEPSPVAGEVTVEPIDDPGSGVILLITVRPSPGRGPYALREGTARQFLKRVDDRLRPMSREEIFSGFAPPRTDRPQDELSLVETHLLNLREKVPGNANGLLWMIIRPVHDPKLAVNGPSMHMYFVDPSLTGNRRTGWNFIDPSEGTHGKRQSISHGSKNGGRVTLSDNGQIEFHLPLRNLYWKGAGGSNDPDPKQIWPDCLLEFPISVFRLASTLYGKDAPGADSTVLADLALFGLRGWTLRRHSPRSFAYLFDKPAEPFQDDDLVMAQPLRFTLEEIVNEPDRCGFRLVQQVYERFGYSEDDIPQEFDRGSGKLVFPSV